MARILSSLIVLALVLTPASPARAAAGDLDPGFGGDGKVTTNFFGNFDEARDVALARDGKIVIAGEATRDTANGDDRDFSAVRYNADGSLDTTFGGDGKVSVDFGQDFEIAFGVAVQNDGKVVAAGLHTTFPFGSTSSDFVVVRFNRDGSLDTTFDRDGLVITDFPGTDFNSADSVVIQSDGRIVVGGSTGLLENEDVGDFALVRYNPNGSLDGTFGTGGRVLTDFAGLGDGLGQIALQRDGKLVAAGTAFLDRAEKGDYAAVRYHRNGTLDTTFDHDGKVTTDFDGEEDEGDALAIQADGKVVVSGIANSTDTTGDFGLVRYNTNGALDTTFGGDGTVKTNFPASTTSDLDQAFAVAIQADGKIVAAGAAAFDNPGAGTDPDDSDFGLARYNQNGTLDATFGTGGMVTTNFSVDNDDPDSHDNAFGIVIQADGRIVAAGRTTSGPPGTPPNDRDRDAALARYLRY